MQSSCLNVNMGVWIWICPPRWEQNNFFICSYSFKECLVHTQRFYSCSERRPAQLLLVILNAFEKLGLVPWNNVNHISKNNLKFENGISLTCYVSCLLHTVTLIQENPCFHRRRPCKHPFFSWMKSVYFLQKQPLLALTDLVGIVVEILLTRLCELPLVAFSVEILLIRRPLLWKIDQWYYCQSAESGK